MTNPTEPIVDEVFPDDVAEEAYVGTGATQSERDDELARLREQLQRARADYDNLVRRSEEDRRSMGAYILGNTISKLLPLADNLERAVSTVPADIAEHAWVAGVRSLRDRFARDLEGMGVRAFVSVGEEVDPDRHEVMSQAPGEAGRIVAEFERGYMIDDRVLRHAKVVVGAGEAL